MNDFSSLLLAVYVGSVLATVTLSFVQLYINKYYSKKDAAQREALLSEIRDRFNGMNLEDDVNVVEAEASATVVPEAKKPIRKRPAKNG